MLTPIGGRTRPMFNVTVSNVPGPSKPLYFRGARMEAVYPISLIAHGIGLNITCESYAGSLDFAFVGCRDTLPHLQNLAVYAAEALVELEAACVTPAAGTAGRPKTGRQRPGGAEPKARRPAAKRRSPRKTAGRRP